MEDHGVACAYSIAEVLLTRARERGGERVFTYLRDGKADESVLTYGELAARSRALAAAVAQRCEPGDRVLIVAPNGVEYILALFACFFARVVAVPVFPPINALLRQRLIGSTENCDPRLALATADVVDAVFAEQGLGLACGRLSDRSSWLQVSDCDALAEAPPAIDLPGGDELALLQYTSGSTGVPKGVMLTHGNLIANERTIGEVMGSTPGSVGVGWLPFHHDMGLIGNLLHTVFAGIHTVLMDPRHFVRDPLSWLKAIDRYRGTISGGPNFAYELLARRLPRARSATFDLSCWRVAFCGAEPIQAATMERFAAAASAYGFDPKALAPCYGLAEATLMVSGTQLGTGMTRAHFDGRAMEAMRASPVAADEPDARALVSAGDCIVGQRVHILSRDGHKPCADGQIGEIAIAGANVTPGYWPQGVSDQAVHVRVPGEREPALRTGDLGFFHDGHLFIAGRAKDLIIVNGRNYFPQDIEQCVAGVSPDLRAGAGACVAIEVVGREAMAVVQEVAPRPEQTPSVLARGIADEVFEDFSVPVHQVVLIKRGTIAKTSSGKIRRRECARQLARGELQIVYAYVAGQNDAGAPTPIRPVNSASAVDEQVLARIHRIVGEYVERSPDEVAAAGSLQALGADSIVLIQVRHALEGAFKVTLDEEELASAQSFEALARQLLQGGGSTASARPEHAPAAVVGPIPLTKPQQALWYLQSLDPRSDSYHIARAFRLHGPADPALLEAALTRLLAAHPLLNACIRSDAAGNPAWHFLRDDTLPLVRAPLAATPGDQRVQRALAPWLAKPFALDAERLFRAVLFEGDGERVLLFVFHHLVCDFESLAVLYRDFAQALEGAEVSVVHGQSALLDFAEQQRRYLDGARARSAGTYWADHLRPLGLPPLRRLACSSRASTGRAGHVCLSWPPTLAVRWSSLRARHGCSGYSMFLALLQAYVAVCWEQDVAPVGTAVTLRRSARHRTLCAYGVNPIPLVQRVELGESGARHLARTQATVRDALAHGRLPLAEILSAAQHTADAGRQGLFDVVLTYLDEAAGADAHMVRFASESRVRARGSLGGALDVESVVLPEQHTSFPLELQVVASRETTQAVLRYRRDLVPEALAHELASGLVALAQWLVDHEDEPLSLAASALAPSKTSPTPAHREDRALTDLGAATLHGMMERWAARAPDATALQAGDRAMSYAELNARADQYAFYLSKKFGSRKAPVLTVGPVSVELVCLLFGLSKAGLPLVNVGLDNPLARIRTIVEGCRPALVVLAQATAEFADALGAELGALDQSVDIVALDELASRTTRAVPASQAGARAPVISPLALAYYAYTSGSTGVPKGIEHTHANLVSFVRWQAEAFEIGPGVAMLQQASMGFDVSLCEIFGALCFGGTLQLISAETRRDPQALLGHLLAARTQVLQIVPSLVRQLAAAHANGAYSGEFALEHVLFVGEPLTGDVVTHARAIWPHAALYNVYGPTECVAATCQALAELPQAGPFPVGRAVAGRTVRVLDDEGSACKAGVVGEICIAGPYLARGYVNLPDATEAAFVADPQAEDQRLYRTGDLGRLDVDGRLSVVGRKDNQVKIHGVRLELEEVDRLLSACAVVREACAFVRRDEARGAPTLHACVVLAGDTEPGDALGQLRAHERSSMASHMRPTSYFVLEALPRNTNGKVDRRRVANQSALPALRGTDSAAGAPVATGDTLTRETLRVLSQVLGHAEVDLAKGFFELGGNSLSAMQLTNCLNQQLQLDLDIRDVLSSPTIGALLSTVEQKRYSDRARQWARAREIVEQVLALSEEEVNERISALTAE